MTDAIEKMSFEEALKELETIVRELEAGGQDLEKSIESYSRGSTLKQHCESKLKEAKLKIDKIVLDENNSPQSTTPLDETAE